MLFTKKEKNRKDYPRGLRSVDFINVNFLLLVLNYSHARVTTGENWIPAHETSAILTQFPLNLYFFKLRIVFN